MLQGNLYKTIDFLLGGLVPTIKRLHWAEARKPGAGERYAVWPEPVDHDVCLQRAGFSVFADTDEAWERDFSALITNLVSSLEAHGTARLAGVTDQPTGSLRLRKEESVCDALLNAASDDQLPACYVEFGPAGTAMLCATDGHPIIWVTLPPGESIGQLLREASEGWPVERTLVDIASLDPESAA